MAYDPGLVSRSLFQLGRTIGDETEKKNRFNLGMANTRLAGSEMDHNFGLRKGDQQMSLADKKDRLAQIKRQEETAAKEKQYSRGRQKVMPMSDILSKYVGPEKAQEFVKQYPQLATAFETEEGFVSGFNKLRDRDYMSPAEKAQHDALMGLRGAQTEYYRNRPAGTANTTQQKYNAELSLANFAGKHGLQADPVSGGFTSKPMTAEEFSQMQSEAASMGLNVYADQIKVKDTGSSWNPFDNKDVPAFVVRSVVPSGATPTPFSSPVRPTATNQQSAENKQQPPKEQTPLREELASLLKAGAKTVTEKQPKMGIADNGNKGTTTKELKEFMESDKAKEPGYRAFVKTPSKEEQDRRREERKQRMSKSFTGRPPK